MPHQRRQHVRAAGIHLHEHRLGPAQPGGQVVRRVHRDHPSVVDDDDALAGLRDLGQDVGAQDDGVIARQAADQVAGLDDLLGVEAGGRLVQDQDVGVVDERLGQPDALPVALRQLAAVPVRHVGHVRALQDGVDALACRSFDGTPLMRATKSRYSRTVMSG